MLTEVCWYLWRRREKAPPKNSGIYVSAIIKTKLLLESSHKQVGSLHTCVYMCVCVDVIYGLCCYISCIYFHLAWQGYIESGLFKFTYGANESLVDFLHGDNFCQAHVKAAEAMEDPASPVVSVL